ncbi:MAG TPA: amidase family protein, partial [Acetobacteraceae bacterium]|nr:amidase family protein [Acetobacteraceae bacterium]
MDLGFASARRMAAMVRRRRIGCLELLDHMIERIERLDERVNAVVVRDFERARRRARTLDRRGSGGGPLHGVPMTVKE